MDTKKRNIIALFGKGGVGKTVISTLMIKLLIEEKSRRILVIDADPAMGLPSALGVKVNKTIADIKNEIIEYSKKAGCRDKEAVSEAIDYLVLETITETPDFCLLVMGRTDEKGCFCPLNSLLREVIEGLAKSFDIVIIDGEAGVEQINRRVMKGVDTPIIVTDNSFRGIETSRTIKRLIEDQGAIDYKTMGIVINKVNGRESSVLKKAKDMAFNILGCIPDDETIAEFDAEGSPLLSLPMDTPSVKEVKKILEKINLVES